MDLELFESISKYPFISEGSFFNSVELNQNKTCSLKCKTKDCLLLQNNDIHLSEYICSNGYNNILIVVGESKFILNGLIYTTNASIPKGRKDSKKNWIVDKNALLIFASKIQGIEKYLTKMMNEASEKNFSMFHDFKTSMNIFFTCTQDIIDRQPGFSFEQKLSKSDDSIKELYHALNLITSQLGMIDVIVNPLSITFGNKKTMNIYKLFHKISILFGHLANKKNITIDLTTERNLYIKDSNCYESIEFIPLILLDNALKYSMPGSNIKIEMGQHQNKVRVKIKSIGPFVKDENSERIFNKFFRDESGKQFSKQGLGMGLWIAQQILNAHSTKLSYHKDKGAYGEIGLNIFEFDLPTTH